MEQGDDLSRECYCWGMAFESRHIIDAVALEYEGHKIKDFLFPNDNGSCVCMDHDFGKNFKLNADRYFLRSELFGFQRYFGKWGGEMVPEWDREYSQYYFTYLQCYRVKLPELFCGYPEYCVKAVRREEASSDLRLCLSRLGNDDLRDWNDHSLEQVLVRDFEAACRRPLPSSIAARPEVALALACNHEVIFRLLSQKCGPRLAMKDLDFARALKAFHTYVDGGRVDDDDNVNRLVFKILQWYMGEHPDRVSMGNRGYILYALMYLHLYRTGFTRFGGTPEGVNAWRNVPPEERESVAAHFRRHLSEMREIAARKGEEQ